MGTTIRVCGADGCLERVVNDRGPFGEGRIIDLSRADFFEICGCPSWAGTATVTVHVY
jgi:rare lipoprotein A (peptidoglycan hydrolase)